MTSTFLTPSSHAREHDLASLHLRRDLSIPVILSTTSGSSDQTGYAEGIVTNTRFGSFPHSTIIGVPWGSQVRASQVDTGSRGRNQSSKKRKAEDISKDDAVAESNSVHVKEAVTASSGFVHVLAPTPENWTTSLPHRTQVVYTPDYSYILHRIRARPGSVLIEAGSGSGSFTHAAARAVFNGYSPNLTQNEDSAAPHEIGISKLGHVYTYEFHAERHAKLSAEMHSHGLSPIVTATHRDVYKQGFLLPSSSSSSSSSDPTVTTSPNATSIFLDLPAPWEALRHLTRTAPSPLSPSSQIHICTFSPCIEQAQRTVSALRKHGWIDITMEEVSQHRIEIRREYTGLKYDGMRGVNPVAKDVDEALVRLRQVEQRAKEFHSGAAKDTHDGNGEGVKGLKKEREQNRLVDAGKTLWKEGTLVHRSEPELKTHTSYLVFAVLPREWSEEDEEKAKGVWNKGRVVVDVEAPKSQRQLKKEAKNRRKEKAKVKTETSGGVNQQAAGTGDIPNSKTVD